MVLHRRAAALGVQCRAELPVGDCVLPKADERSQQADDPEALCFHHDAVHRLLPDHAAGHLGQRTDRHVVLEQQVQVRRALAGAALEQGVQHSPGQPAQRAELDWLLYNTPLEYAQLVLGGEMEHYRSLDCDHGRLED